MGIAGRLTTIAGAILLAYLLYRLTWAALVHYFIPLDSQGRYKISRDLHLPVLLASASLLVFVTTVALAIRLVYARRPIDRIVLVPLAYIAACAAGAFALALPITVWKYGAAVLASTSGLIDLYLHTVLLTLNVIAFALIPTLIVVVWGERRRIRHFAYYAVLGALIAPLVYGAYVYFMGGPRMIHDSLVQFALLTASNTVLAILVTAGAIASAVYWAIAGRTAGAHHDVT